MQGRRASRLPDTLGLPLGVIGDLTSQVLSWHVDERVAVPSGVQRLHDHHRQAAQHRHGIRGLENAAASNGNRFIIYKNDPDVVRLHMPKALSFYDHTVTEMEMTRIATVRLGGLEIRRPGGVRYGDLI